jgi:hypothetical protein
VESPTQVTSIKELQINIKHKSNQILQRIYQTPTDIICRDETMVFLERR